MQVKLAYKAIRKLKRSVVLVEIMEQSHNSKVKNLIAILDPVAHSIISVKALVKLSVIVLVVICPSSKTLTNRVTFRIKFSN